MSNKKLFLTSFGSGKLLLVEILGPNKFIEGGTYFRYPDGGSDTTVDKFLYDIPEGLQVVGDIKAETSEHICEIGIYGKAYDGLDKCRAYTYRHQPNNADASRIGAAAREAACEISGDNIDVGLKLLKRLEGFGFGIFEVAKVEVPHHGE